MLQVSDREGKCFLHNFLQGKLILFTCYKLAVVKNHALVVDAHEVFCKRSYTMVHRNTLFEGLVVNSANKVIFPAMLYCTMVSKKRCTPPSTSKLFFLDANQHLSILIAAECDTEMLNLFLTVPPCPVSALLKNDRQHFSSFLHSHRIRHSTLCSTIRSQNLSQAKSL